jgi:hypothetical protein
MAAKHPWKVEFRILWRGITQKRMLLVIPAAVSRVLGLAKSPPLTLQFNSFYYGGIA